MKIGLLAFDYDGTIARIDTRREISEVPSRIANPITRASSIVPIAIITSKDFHFVHPKTTFAHVWACLSGLEIRFKNGYRLISKNLKDISHLAESQKEKYYVEEKIIEGIGVAGFSLDWRRKADLSSKEVKSLKRFFKCQG